MGTLKQNPDGTFPMRTTSRRVGKTGKTTSQTRGKDKNESCQKTDLKTWGMNANPYKLSGGDVSKYEAYCQQTNAMNR
jgi:hypothetical protein